MVIEKLRTLIWFAGRPDHWSHAAALDRRKLEEDRDRPELRAAATNWARAHAVPVEEALGAVGVTIPREGLPEILGSLLEEAANRARQSRVEVGGPGDLRLLHAAVRLSGAERVVETGVAYGWSSLAILAAMSDRRDGRLVSVDMPYPKMGNEAFVGMVVPEPLRKGWILIRQPDRHALERAIRLFDGRIDLCHYDSDKSWQGRTWAYPRLWDALSQGGILISDDIQDNLAFSEMVEALAIPFAVTESAGKFVGIIRKP
ncbi:O-methyltransferase [Thermaurantiacus sp.]